MNSKKQVMMVGAIFIVIFSILFFNIRAEYSKEYKITKKEIVGINEITDIYKLDLLIKSIRGINQLKDEDAKSLKNSLFINEDDLLEKIKKLKYKRIENFYSKMIIKKDKLSKMELYEEYTKLLKMVQNKRIDKADSSYLLFESDREISFLINITVLNIPQTIENIGKIRALGIRLLDQHIKHNNEVEFLLEANIKSFMDKVEEIKYIIEKLEPNNKNKLNSLLNLIVSDFYNIKSIVSNVKKNRSTLNSKEYFLEISKLVNKIDILFFRSKEILTEKLEIRKLELENKLLIGNTIYILLMSIVLFSIFYIYCKFDKDTKLLKIKKEQDRFIQELQKDYIKSEDLKQICNKSLQHIINYFNAINGSLYLFDEENQKLYLGATYGIKYDSLSQVLDLNENLISENILEKKIKIIDINKKINLGNIKIIATKLITIPIMEFDKSIGTIQLLFDDKFDKTDIEFLEMVISLMGTYINKAQKDEESDRYLKLIDKNVLISKTDLDGNIIEVSEQFCNFYQYKQDELLGKTHRIFKHKDMKDEIFVELWSSIKRGDIWNGEIKNRKKDGSYNWVNIYIIPDCDINENIIGYTAIQTDITDRKKVEEIAITDGLTSLYNRRYFDNIFPQQILISKREKYLLAFVLIDIDHFKQYNDTYGHQEGDTTLKLVSKALKATLKRPNDYTFRLGGEEFGLVYHIDNIQDAILIANQAKENIENLKIEHSGNSASKFVTISSGIYILNNNDNSTVDEIYKKSDEALYKSKNSGRNRVSVVE